LASVLSIIEWFLTLHQKVGSCYCPCTTVHLHQKVGSYYCPCTTVYGQRTWSQPPGEKQPKLKSMFN
jgi:ferredoxin-thioredoxin reductase catalytic subunit